MSNLLPSLTWKRDQSSNNVHLTFDDGPHPEITPWVMNELDKYNAKATFFLVGENAEKYPKVVDLILSKGHTIGNHTQTHVKGWSVTTEKYIDNIKQCAAVIPLTKLFRPPFGKINFGSITRLEEYEIIMWDVLSRDYQDGIDTSSILKKMKHQTVGGSIAVFHDSEKAEKNLKMMLPEYLKFLDSEKYSVVAL